MSCRNNDCICPKGSQPTKKMHTFIVLSLIIAQFTVSCASAIGYVNIESSICKIDTKTGAHSDCFTLPFDINPMPSCIYQDTTFYFVSRNYSDPQTPILFVAVEVVTHKYWTASLNSSVIRNSESPVVAYSKAHKTPLLLLDLGVFLVKMDSVQKLRGNPYSQSVGALDSQLLSLWYLPASPSNAVSYVSLSQITEQKQFPTPLPLRTIAYDPRTSLVYGLAQISSHDLLLYSWNWNFDVTFSVVGVIRKAGAQAITVSGIQDGNLTFVCSTIFSRTLMTISLKDASVVSISSPLSYDLTSWTPIN
jgi:hypothetical protein